MTGALDGYRVLDLTQGVTGPFTAMRLGDAGAAVVKVEPLEGDMTRFLGPDINGESALFMALNRNKRSLALDRSLDVGQKVLDRLVGNSDVVLVDWSPRLPRHLDYDAMTATNPDIVYCSISPFGEEGPMADLPGSELVVQAMSDYVNSLGVTFEEPVRVGTDIAAMNTGIFAVQAVVAALLHRARGGPGQRVCVSMLGSLLHIRGLLWTCMSNPDDWFGVFNEGYTKAPERGYETTDGRVFWGLRRGDSEDWDRLLIELDMLEYLEDPRFADFGRMATSIGRYAPEVKDIWERAFREKGLGVQDVISLVHSVRGDAVPFSDYATLVGHPQVAAIDALQDVEHPSAGTVRSVGPAWTFSQEPAAVQVAAPTFGQHSEEILLESGLSRTEIKQLRQAAVTL
ncbi:CaiB/BaiF CoA transferase family protein [Sciscionella marina]|uniref:CaiB/BaiF CoA transferase family protein n=1 Tax=Sciscionella marina TaxID=508770 RepID=UPI000374DBE3|nr:CaiB/BaiF CoA-transferase family protein [Sciscionella marina]